jgi:hypothetical protein
MRNNRTRIVAPLILCIIALWFFSRTVNADSVRWVQILLLFAAGMNAGVLLAHLLRRGEAGPT